MDARDRLTPDIAPMYPVHHAGGARWSARWLRPLLGGVLMAVGVGFGWTQESSPERTTEPISEMAIAIPTATQIDPAAVPEVTIENLRKLAPANLPRSFVRVRATARMRRARNMIEVYDSTGSMFVRTEQTSRIHRDQAHDFIGTPVMRAGELILDDAQFNLIRVLPTDDAEVEFRNYPNILDQQIRAAAEPTGYEPVSIEGVATYLDRPFNTLMVQDNSSGAWVEISTEAPEVSIGDEVRVSGYSSPGEFAPIIARPTIEVISNRSLPAPRIVNGHDFISGRFDGLRVTLRGTVRNIRHGETHLDLDLTCDGVRIPLRFPSDHRPLLPERILGAEIQATGTCSIFYNQYQQIGGFRLLVPDLSSIDLRILGPANVFDLPLQSIADLARWSSEDDLFARKHIRGTVLYTVPNQTLFVEDDTGTVEIRTHNTSGSEPDDLVNVVGYPTFHTFGQVLEDGIVQNSGPGNPPEPLPLQADARQLAFAHGELVRLDAVYLDQIETEQGTLLLFEADEQLLEGLLGPDHDSLPGGNLLEGTQVRITGVGQVREGSDSGVLFRLLMRSPDDIQVISQPPWWTLNRALAALAIVVTASLVALLWAAALRRRVNTQTNIIRQRLEKEAALERDYRNLFLHSSDLIFSCDTEGRILSVNPSAQASLGYSESELIGRLATDFVCPNDRHKLTRFPSLAGQESSSATEFRLISNSGDERIFEINADLVQTDADTAVYQGIGRDITERRRAENLLRAREQQLRQAQKMEAIGTLAGGIAHDFNNILTGILGYVELASTEVAPDSSVHADLENVRKAGIRARDLVQQILTYSRRIEQEKHPVDLSEIITEVCKLLRASIPHSVEFQITLEPNCPRVLADATQLHQVLMNLVTNAYHALRESGGRIHIQLHSRSFKKSTQVGDSTLPPGGYSELQVSDTGPGIPQDTLTRIFEPYFSTKTKGAGSGMGLAVVLGIVQSHGGGIAAESQPGQGTTFKILLPATDKTTPSTATDPAPEATGKGRVLLVDDESMITSLGQRMLSRLGYDVSTSNQPVAALAQIKQDPDAFDLVLSDQSMPGMDGVSLLREIKRLRPALPVLLCTGFTEDSKIDAAREHGAADVIKKPFDQAELSRAVASALGLTD